jgi:hypothetical protein
VNDENNHHIPAFRITIMGNNWDQYVKRTNDDEIIFNSEAIGKTFQIEISRGGYKPEKIDFRLTNEKFQSNQCNQINVKLEKEVKPKPGKPEPEGKNATSGTVSNGNLSVGCSLALALTLALVVVFVVLAYPQRDSIQSINKSQIEEYVSGFELKPDSLKALESQWDKELHRTASWLSIFRIRDKSQPDYKKEIATAIALRSSIKEGNIASLKEHKYSSQQGDFKESINKIDPNQYKLVGDSLKKISDLDNLSLEEIARKINSIVSVLEESPPPRQREKQGKNDREPKKEQKQSKEQSLPPATNNDVQQSASTDEVDDIANELKGNDINQQKLEEYQHQARFAALESSIQLYLAFWGKVKNSNQMDDFNALLERIKKDDVLGDSELKYVLEIICKDSKAFESCYIKNKTSLRKTPQTTLNDLKSQLLK